jgi:hypothetical protein
MTFSYDETLAADNDFIRLKIGDTVENEGPRPDGRNFSDAELTATLADESSIVGAAIAACFETLWAEWEQFRIAERKDNVSFDGKQVDYKALADYWRKKSNTVPKQQASFKAHVISSW